MALRNTQPFYKGAGGTDGTGASWPLRPYPYHSRVEDQRIAFDGGLSEDRAKNYQFIAYRPGFALQASELNEMQEHFQMQLTLSIAMMHNWITSGSGPLWNGFDNNADGSEGGVTPFGFDTSIGQGGGYGTSGVFHDPNFAISAPGWRGACPLHPYQNPYQGIPNSIAPTTAQYFPTTNRIVITFWPGWWLTEVRRPWNGTGDEPEYVSGLKHWVYLDTTTNAEADPNFQVSIDLNQVGTNRKVVVGLITNSDYYSCCPEEDSTPELPCDPTLADNADGAPNEVACGASRYGVYFSRAKSAMSNEDGTWGEDWENGAFADKENIAAVCKIDTVNRTVRYMNNLMILNYG